jgi:ribosomal protein S18 acetylase RimI-like enzyme
MATLYLFTKFGKRSGQVEDVVVDSDFRGQHLGEEIMQRIIEVARDNKVATLHLTSRPVRVAANKLYQKMGFEKKETNVYRLRI